MNQIESSIIRRLWRPDVYFDFEKHSTRDNLFNGNMLLEISPQVGQKWPRPNDLSS